MKNKNVKDPFSTLESNSFSKILYVFRMEVLKDFLKYLKNHFNMPSNFVFSDKFGRINFLDTEEATVFYPEFCLKMQKVFKKDKAINLCNFFEENFFNSLQDKSVSKYSSDYFLSSCHMGIKRIIFPIKIRNRIEGALIFGKFLLGEPNEKDNIKTNLNELDLKSSNIDTFLKKDLHNSIGNLPLLSKDEIHNIANDVNMLLSIIKPNIINFPTENKIVRGITFLNDINKVFSKEVLSDTDLWSAVKLSLHQIKNHLDLKSAQAYYNSQDEILNFDLKTSVPDFEGQIDHIYLDSNKSYEKIMNVEHGIIFPTKENSSLFWINSLTKKLFMSNYAIVYAKKVFGPKGVILAFGFKENQFLSSLEKILLKESVITLFRHINTVLAATEIDHIMSTTSHMLRRSISKISSGIEVFDRYGFDVRKADSKEILDLKKLSIKSIKSGIFRLNLIARNFKAFRDIREATFSNKIQFNELSNVKQFDVLTIINQIVENYEIELQNQKKKLIKDYDYNEVKVWGHLNLFELMFWNLFDNAFKYSYSNTNITINIKLKNDNWVITITNLGIGIAKDELDMVFTKYYQSRLVDPKKMRVGSGSGLSIAKSYFENFCPEGSISINSWKTDRAMQRFEGDRWLTRVKLIMPKG
jgi:signal transduction histidine kinase/ligand-binding sensor protein